MSPIQVVFVAPSLAEASARLRIRAVLAGLAEEGVEAAAREIPAPSRKRFRFFRDLSGADVVVLHRKLLNFIELAFLRRNARRLVFDFDDAVMVRDPFRGPSRSARRTRRFGNVVAKADGVIAGNAHLADRALEAGARGEVRILPTALDPSKYGEGPKPPEDRTVLGWIGQKTTLPYLEDILPTLDGLAGSLPGLELRVISDAFPAPKTLPLDARTWSVEEEGRLLAGIDVGLMPLRDDPWSRGKGGYKILQYFASGKPVVASPVGVNRDLVRPGETGFQARDADEWKEGIAGLATDPERRRILGEEGRRLLRAGGYTLEAYTGNLAAFLRQMA
ncbi:MAG: glycosyltransferase family 4 protein [Planctomycetota bacterium]